MSASRKGKSGKKAERAQLFAELDQAGRELSTAAVLFHTTVAEKRGLSVTEEKSLEILGRFGPISAGELSERTGLAPASVTGLVDRLERRGYVRRVRDPNDGRRVLVEVDTAAVMAGFAPLFEDFMRSLHKLYERYSDDELRMIACFLREAAACQTAAAARLSERSVPSETSR